MLDESASGQDVTDQYVDLQSRLRNLEATEATIRSFLEKAETVEESLQVNRQLSEITDQIEEIKGKYLKRTIRFREGVLEAGEQVTVLGVARRDTMTDAHESYRSNKERAVMVGLAEAGCVPACFVEGGYNQRIEYLAEYARNALRKLPGVTILTPSGPQAGLLTFTMDELDPAKAMAKLARDGIILRFIRHPYTLRISTGFYNTEEDIDRLVAALQDYSDA